MYRQDGSQQHVGRFSAGENAEFGVAGERDGASEPSSVSGAVAGLDRGLCVASFCRNPLREHHPRVRPMVRPDVSIRLRLSALYHTAQAGLSTDADTEIAPPEALSPWRKLRNAFTMLPPLNDSSMTFLLVISFQSELKFEIYLVEFCALVSSFCRM